MAEPRKKRLEWMDHVRGVAIVLVIAFHSNTLLRFGYESPEILTAINSTLGPYRMPILVFISGFIAYMSMRKPTAPFIWGKIRNLAWPYIVWTVIYALTVGANYSLTDHELYISYLWYIGYIFCYYFASWIVRDTPRLPLILVAFTLAAAVPEDINAVRRFFFLWGIFMFGELFQRSNNFWNKVITSRSVFLALISIGVASIFVLRGDRVVYETMWIAPVMAGIILFCAVALRVQRFSYLWPLRSMAYVGRRSIVYYTAHFPLIWGTVVTASELGIQNVWLVYVASFIFAFVVCTGLSVANDKLPLVSLLFQLPKRSF